MPQPHKAQRGPEPARLMTPRHVPNNELIASRLPSPDASWEDISRLALTFDGYKHCGSVEACTEIAQSKRHSTLSDLRTCLFCEQRKWRNQGEEPDAFSMRYIYELLEQIRLRVQLANELLR